MSKATNRFPGKCAACKTWTPKASGFFVKKTLVCRPCVQLVLDDVATNATNRRQRVIQGGDFIRCAFLPLPLVKWLGRENGMSGNCRLTALARQWRKRRLLGELLASD